METSDFNLSRLLEELRHMETRLTSAIEGRCPGDDSPSVVSAAAPSSRDLLPSPSIRDVRSSYVANGHQQESESAPPPVVYDCYDEPNRNEIAKVLALLEAKAACEFLGDAIDSCEKVHDGLVGGTEWSRADGAVHLLHSSLPSPHQAEVVESSESESLRPPDIVDIHVEPIPTETDFASLLAELAACEKRLPASIEGAPAKCSVECSNTFGSFTATAAPVPTPDDHEAVFDAWLIFDEEPNDHIIDDVDVFSPWYEVSCCGNGSVQRLQLERLCLAGSASDLDVLAGPPDLRALNLSNNAFSGTFSNMSALPVLNHGLRPSHRHGRGAPNSERAQVGSAPAEQGAVSQARIAAVGAIPRCAAAHRVEPRRRTHPRRLEAVGLPRHTILQLWHRPRLIGNRLTVIISEGPATRLLPAGAHRRGKSASMVV